MTHEATSAPFTPAAARAFMAVLRAGLLVLAEWLLAWFGAETRMPRHIKLEVRAILRDAREDLFCVLIETFAHRLAPQSPQRPRSHDHRARRKVRSPTPSHRSAISLRRVLKRTLPAPGRTLRQRFAAVFFMLRRMEPLLRRIRATLAKPYTSAWAVTDVAPIPTEGRALAPALRDSS